jgi:hypothetical protein
METDLAKRHKTMLVLWFALLASIGMYFLMTVALKTDPDGPVAQPSSPLTLGLAVLGLCFVIISFAVKSKVLNQAVERQNLAAVQVAFLITWAICEVSALLGFVVFWVFRSPEYYLLFFFAAAGMVLHVPRRSHLEAAQWRTIKSSRLTE